MIDRDRIGRQSPPRQNFHWRIRPNMSNTGTSPAGFNLATNASNAPPLLSCNGETVGRFAEEVKPGQINAGGINGDAGPRSSPLPPK